MSTKKARPAAASPQPTSNRSTYVIAGLAVVVIAVVVIVGVLWSSKSGESRNEGYGNVSNAAVQVTTDTDGTILLGQPEAATTIDLFEDPMCPYCAELEHTHGQEMAKEIDEGRLAVRFHTLDFLNRLSASGDYSSRAAGALMCVADSGDAIAFSAFHAAVFSPDNQPAENGDSDHSNAELADMARAAGAGDEAVTCIADGTKVEEAAAAAQTGRETLSSTGASGTPAVIHNGTVVDTFGNQNWVLELN